MATYSTDRRGLLKIIGAIGATCTAPFAGDELFAQASAPERKMPTPAARQFLGERDFQTISQISERIIPQTDTPGAIQSGVPAYIDQAVARNAGYQGLVADGLRWLDREAEKIRPGAGFSELSAEQQIEILLPLCEANDQQQKARSRIVQFFALIKSLTADGYYTSEAGLVHELGFEQEMRHEYPACEG